MKVKIRNVATSFKEKKKKKTLKRERKTWSKVKNIDRQNPVVEIVAEQRKKKKRERQTDREREREREREKERERGRERERERERERR